MSMMRNGEEVAPTLTCNNANGGQRMPDKDNFNCLLTDEGKKVHYRVRRLTPRECERLQGFPDDWTLIGYPEEVEVDDYEVSIDEQGNEKKLYKIGSHKETKYYYTDSNGKRKECADGARYKALGNSIALPFWDWLIKNITEENGEPLTLGSLFDGIGGFPLCWEKYNGKGTARWASEIEEFPIAVTKWRFPEE